MIAITLHQPWAQLLADGRKRYETRGWAPQAVRFGERIAIHAGLKWDLDLAAAAESFGYHGDMPRGVIVATARLVAWHQCAQPYGEPDVNAHWYVRVARTVGTDPDARMVDGRLLIREDRYGDYGPGRWAWRFDELEVVDPPAPARGAQGFWRWRP